MCQKMQLYSTPELNDKLYLHYKGWRKIQNLEAYTGLKVVYLEGNGFTKIEGLDALVELRALYLQENSLEKIENLEALVHLDTLNLSQNGITKIENIGHFLDLRTLMITHNQLRSAADLEGVTACPSITCLDLKNNKIDDPEALEVFKRMPNLRVLYLKGNEFTGKVKCYRKLMIASLPNLTYLDERPVDKNERLQAEAWLKFGPDAEKAERERQAAEQAEKDRNYHVNFRRWVAQQQAIARGEDPNSLVFEEQKSLVDNEEDVVANESDGDAERELSEESDPRGRGAFESAAASSTDMPELEDVPQPVASAIASLALTNDVASSVIISSQQVVEEEVPSLPANLVAAARLPSFVEVMD